MSDRTFLDTNVLVYLYDTDAPEKQRKARDVLERSPAQADLVIGTQVLQEFYVTVTRKVLQESSRKRGTPGNAWLA